MNPERFKKPGGWKPQPTAGDDGAYQGRRSLELKGSATNQPEIHTPEGTSPMWKIHVVKGNEHNRAEVDGRRQGLAEFTKNNASTFESLSTMTSEKLHEVMTEAAQKRTRFFVRDQEQLAWGQLSAQERVGLRQQEMMSIAAQAELYKQKYLKAALKPKTSDTKEVLQFDKRVADYLETDDLPGAFKESLRSVMDSFKQDPRYKDIELQSLKVVPSVEAVPPAPIPVVAPPLPEDKSSVVLGGNINLHAPDGEWYRNKVVNIVGEEAPRVLGEQDAIFAQRFMEHLPDHLEYNRKSRWGKLWMQAKTFGFWRTVMQGGKTEQKMRLIRYESANILRRRAATGEAKDKAALNDIAGLLDKLNEEEPSTNDWRATPAQVAQMEQAMRQEQIQQIRTESTNKSVAVKNEPPKQAA